MTDRQREGRRVAYQLERYSTMFRPCREEDGSLGLFADVSDPRIPPELLADLEEYKPEVIRYLVEWEDEVQRRFVAFFERVNLDKLYFPLCIMPGIDRYKKPAKGTCASCGESLPWFLYNQPDRQPRCLECTEAIVRLHRHLTAMRKERGVL